MLTVVIRDDGEDAVTRLTYENLWRELKDIPDSKLLTSKDWFSVLPEVKTTFVCFVESDCLVNSGYFASQLGLFKKNPDFRRLAMLSSSVGVKYWAVKFFGYDVRKIWNEDGVELRLPHVEPIKEKKSRNVYPVQIGYLPGSIIRTNMLQDLKADFKECEDLIELSTRVSLAFWRGGDGGDYHQGHRVHINPNTTYVTTEEYVNDLGEFDPEASDLMEFFRREGI